MTKKKGKVWLILSIILVIVSMVLIVVFEADNEPVFETETEKVALLETEIECNYEHEYTKGWVYKVRIDCRIENVSEEDLFVQLFYTVKTTDGAETYEIETSGKILEEETEYAAWAEFSHPTKEYGILEKVSASVNGSEKAELSPKVEMPLTLGAMISSVFFIVGIVGVILFSKKVRIPLGEITDEDYDEYFGDGYDPDREESRDEENHEIKALKEEIEKEKLQSTLTEMRSKKPKVCEYCGTKNDGKNTQCSNCGARLK